MGMKSSVIKNLTPDVSSEAAEVLAEAQAVEDK